MPSPTPPARFSPEILRRLRQKNSGGRRRFHLHQGHGRPADAIWTEGLVRALKEAVDLPFSCTPTIPPALPPCVSDEGASRRARISSIPRCRPSRSAPPTAPTRSMVRRPAGHRVRHRPRPRPAQRIRDYFMTLRQKYLDSVPLDPQNAGGRRQRPSSIRCPAACSRTCCLSSSRRARPISFRTCSMRFRVCVRIPAIRRSSRRPRRSSAPGGVQRHHRRGALQDVHQRIQGSGRRQLRLTRCPSIEFRKRDYRRGAGHRLPTRRPAGTRLEKNSAGRFPSGSSRRRTSSPAWIPQGGPRLLQEAPRPEVRHRRQAHQTPRSRSIPFKLCSNEKPASSSAKRAVAGLF